MDIWQWVEQLQDELEEQGEKRLARSIDLIPDHAYNDRHEAVDALFPEALSSAKRLGLGWLEIYLRHWHLRSRVGRRMEANQWLGEAVDLLDFAHREENLACPQSVCATQDVAGAYELKDHVGYAPERIQVASEALGRIDAKWQCFLCISDDYASALIDAGRAEEALLFIEKQIEAIWEAEEPSLAKLRVAEFADNRVDALVALERYDEALDLALSEVERLSEESGRGHSLHRMQIIAARLHTLLGHDELAWGVMPPFDVVKKTPSYYPELVRTLDAMLSHGVMNNTWQVGASMWELAQKMRDNGAIRYAVEAGHMYLRHAVARGSVMGAREAMRWVEELQEQLKVPYEEGAEELAKIRQQLEQASPWHPEPWEEVEELLVQLGESPERDLDTLEEAVVQRPEEASLWGTLSSAWEAIGFGRKRVDVARRAFEVMGDEERFDGLVRVLFELGEFGALGEFVESQMSGPWRHQALMAQGMMLEAKGQRGEAIERLRVIRQEQPEHPHVRFAIARMSREEGRLKDALEVLNEQIDKFEPKEPGDAHWERMVVSTMLGRWEDVHESAALIGFEFDAKQGPIDEPFSACRIGYMDEVGTPMHYAHRNSPVTARIMELGGIDDKNRYGELVVFDPQVLNPKPEDHPQDEPYTYNYAAVHTLEPSPYRESYLLHGPYKDKEQLGELMSALRERGFALEVASGEDIRMWDEENQQEVSGVYLLLGIRQDVVLSDAVVHLEEVMREQPYEMLTLRLLDEIGDEAKLERQRAKHREYTEYELGE